jgi:hypothetical protein
LDLFAVAFFINTVENLGDKLDQDHAYLTEDQLVLPVVKAILPVFHTQIQGVQYGY